MQIADVFEGSFPVACLLAKQLCEGSGVSLL